MLADNNAALAGLITASIVVPLTILVAVVWFFFRSARRFDREQEQAEADTCGLSLTAWLMPAPPDPLCLPSFQISQKSRNIGLLQSMGKETACVSQEASISALVLRNGVI